MWEVHSGSSIGSTREVNAQGEDAVGGEKEATTAAEHN